MDEKRQIDDGTFYVSACMNYYYFIFLMYELLVMIILTNDLLDCYSVYKTMPSNNSGGYHSVKSVFICRSTGNNLIMKHCCKRT